MLRTEDQWISEYQQRGALWIHDGNPKRPHVVLASGKHSNGFFNGEIIMEDAYLLSEACSNLLYWLEQDGLVLSTVDRIVGPAYGAITMAHELARQITEGTGHRCLRAYPIKINDRTAEKKLCFDKTTVRPDELVLGCEDTTTTGDSVRLALEAAEEKGGKLLRYVALIVNRSGKSEIRGCKIIALIDRHLPMWDAVKCPLCAQGSPTIEHAKKPENWELLNAEY